MKKTKFVLQAIQTVTTRLKNLLQFFKLKGSFYVLTLSAILIYMPYAHVKYNPTDIEGIFGFKWMSSFLFALALPSVLISSGLLLSFLSRYLVKEMRSFVKVLSFLTLGSGCFFLAWTFYTTPSEFKDFEATTYYLILLALTIGFFIVAYLIEKAFLYTEEKLQNALNAISHFAFIGIKQFIHPDKMDEYKKKSIETLKQGMEHER